MGLEDHKSLSMSFWLIYDVSSIVDSFVEVNHAMIIIFKEKQRGCKNSFYLVIVDSFLEVNRAMIIIFF